VFLFTSFVLQLEETGQTFTSLCLFSPLCSFQRYGRAEHQMLSLFFEPVFIEDCQVLGMVPSAGNMVVAKDIL
jgi:hypothetical protein